MFTFEEPNQELTCNDIGLYNSKHAPNYETEEELVYWAQGKGEIILQVRCDDGLMFLVKKIDWDAKESIEFDQFWRDRGVVK